MNSGSRSFSPKKSTALAAKLKEVREREQEAQTQRLAQKLGLPYLNLFIAPINPDTLSLLPEQESRQASLVCLQKFGKSLKVAVVDPRNSQTIQVLEKLRKQGFKISLFAVSPRSLKKALERYKTIPTVEGKITGEVAVSAQLIKRLQAEIKNLQKLQQEIEKLVTGEISKVVEIILAAGLNLNASDIHFEAKEKNILLRYRIDGILHDAAFLSQKIHRFVLNRIKLLSKLKINIHDVAQDGRFTIKLDRQEIEIRSSVVPGAFGESIVLRILNPQSLISLEELGMRKDILPEVAKEIKKPNGMFITTGPTGSGKTTALYAFLKKIAKPEIKIITLEDPVEYRLEDITQTQIDPKKGYTFAHGLKSTLRHDPDVIMVGEIRDQETAQTAVQAALTGHLVFSTLHTNDASGAIPRLIEMKVKPTFLASALNVAMAQRLVRRICSACKKKYQPKKEELDKIKKALKGLPKTISYPKKEIKLSRGSGCTKCEKTGYKGRIGIFEIILPSKSMKKLISQSPSALQVEELACREGMVTMYQDGILKALEGITTLEEVERVMGE